ncbi:MAG TPA: hypothetical protein VM095_17040 [Pyrinomonadaceae bacterium]|nr:hypothetical protein [Pyrinomonadaceae bacterium]
MLNWLKAIDSSSLWISFLIIFLLGTWVGIFKADPQLKNKPYKRPMLAFETAGSPKQSAQVLEVSTKADPDAREKFHTALLWDFLFICLYPLSTAIACLLAARFLDARGTLDFKYGLAFVLLPFTAGILDVFENVSLLRILRGPVESPWPEIARWCALPKFAILGVSLLFALAGGVVWLIHRFKR